MEPMRLLCVAGISPAIVTETVWALCMDEARDVQIVEVVVVTTSEGRAKLEPLGMQLEQMALDWPQLAPRLAGVVTRVEVIKDAEGAQLPDVRTSSDNKHMVLQLQRLIEQYTRADEPRLHASLAGGRKTMGHYLGSLMSLFARDEDGVSHVLVSQRWAEQAGFWYPLPAACEEPRAWFTERGVEQPHHASEAVVELCEIPLLRLRSLVVDNSYGSSLGQYRFEELLALAQRRVDGAPLRVRVVRGAWDIFVDDAPLMLAPTAHIVLARALVLHHEGRGLPLRALELCANEGGEVLEQMRLARLNALRRRKERCSVWSRPIPLFTQVRADQDGLALTHNALGKARTAIRAGLRAVSPRAERELELKQTGGRDGTFTLELAWEHIEIVDR